MSEAVLIDIATSNDDATSRADSNDAKTSLLDDDNISSNQNNGNADVNNLIMTDSNYDKSSSIDTMPNLLITDGKTTTSNSYNEDNDDDDDDSDASVSVSEDEKSQENDYYRKIFDIYDVDKSGSVSLDRFIEITRENMADQWHSNERRVKELVNELDPTGIGKINFEQFKFGISKLSQDQSTLDENENQNINENDIYRPNNQQISFNESSQLDDNTNSLLQIDDESDQLAPNMNKKSSRPYDNASFDEPFGTLNPIREVTGNLLDFDEADDDTDSSSINKNRNHYTRHTNASSSSSSIVQPLTSSSSTSMTKSSTMNQLNDEAINHDHDIFGIDMETIDNHRRNLSSNNFSSLSPSSNENGNSDDLFGDIDLNVDTSSMVNTTRRSIVSSKRRASELYNQNRTNDFDDSRNHNNGLVDEELIENYEKKIRELEELNKQGDEEREELYNRLNKTSIEYSSLMEKMRYVEDQNQELDKRYQEKLQEEKQVQSEAMNKMKAQYLEENDQLRAQIHQLESHLNIINIENLKYQKEINEIHKKIDITDVRLNEETDKYKQLKDEFQRVLKEKDLLKETNERETFEMMDKIEVLNRELNETNLKFQQLSDSRRRDLNASLSEENMLSSQLKDAENELRQVKAENQSLTSQVSELNAQLFKSNFESGRKLLHLTTPSSSQSFAAEVDTMSKDDLMENLRKEQQISQRLREYVDNMLSKIMEHSPELLEVMATSGSLNGSSSMSMTSSTTSSSFKSNGTKPKLATNSRRGSILTTIASKF